MKSLNGKKFKERRYQYRSGIFCYVFNRIILIIILNIIKYNNQNLT